MRIDGETRANKTFRMMDDATFPLVLRNRNFGQGIELAPLNFGGQYTASKTRKSIMNKESELLLYIVSLGSNDVGYCNSRWSTGLPSLVDTTASCSI